MKSISLNRGKQGKRLVVALIATAIVASVATGIFIVTNRDAGALYYGNTGSGGPPSGTTGAGIPYTWHGNGWRLFDKASGGPSGGFKSGSWGAIQATCADYDQVWVHLILGQNGNEVGYSFDPISSNPGRAEWGGDAYAFTAAGQKRPGSPGNWPAAGSGEAISIVTGVYNMYTSQGGPSNLWMNAQIGWFCWGEAKPWNVSPTTSSQATAEVGDTITWTHGLRNNGPGELTTNVGWWAENTGSGWPTNGTIANWTMGDGTGSGGTASNTTGYVVQPSDFGKVLCRRTVAQPQSKDNGSAIGSSSACVSIVKKPKIQVWGGDLNVGRATGTNPAQTSVVRGSISRGTDNRYYGSWVEYGIAASGSVAGVGSGSASALGAGSGAMAGLSALTFANTGACIGCYSQTTSAPDVASRFPIGPATPDVPWSSANAININRSGPALQGLYKYNGTNTIRITASGRVPAGKQVIIHAPNASVIIDSNIQYTNGTITSVANIPQVVIIARNITIAESVSAVDSWLITTGVGTQGYINTCGRVTAGSPTSATLNGGTCTARLTVNGPVVTNKLYLYRTAGALGNNEAVSDPAEVFNLRADAYIWGSSYSAGAGRLPTVTTTEVPPRF